LGRYIRDCRFLILREAVMAYRLKEVMNRLKGAMSEQADAVIRPMNAWARAKFDVYLGDLRDGTAKRKPDEALIGVIGDNAFYTKLGKLESGKEMLEAIIEYLEKFLEDYEKNPDKYGDMDVGGYDWLKSICLKYKQDRIETDREQEVKDKEKEQKDAGKEQEKDQKADAKEKTPGLEEPKDSPVKIQKQAGK
jgi:hypothetical protein